MSKNKFIVGFMLGAGLGAAGGFMLQKNKRHIKAKLWYLKMQADIERELRSLKKFTREAHDEIIEDAIEEYGTKADLSAAKLAVVERELKSKWKEAKGRFETAAEEAEDTEEDDDE